MNTAEAYELVPRSSEAAGHEAVAWVTAIDSPVDVPYTSVAAASQLPAPVLFQARFDALTSDALDLPENKQSWPLMSTRMLRTLQAVREFECVEHPVVLLDCRYEPDACFDNGAPVPERTRTDYVLVFTDPIAAIDWERCRIARDDSVFDDYGEIDGDLMLATPGDGFPPVFRIVGAETRLFASSAARKACEAAGLVGLEFGDVRHVRVFMFPLDIVPAHVRPTPDDSSSEPVAGHASGSRTAKLSGPAARPLTATEERELDEWGSVGAHMDEFYEFDIDNADGAIKAVNAAVDNYRRLQDVSRYKLPELRSVDDLAMALASWWAAILQRETDCKQVMLCWEGEDREELAVVPEDSSWAVLPIRFLQRLLTDPTSENTTILTFNMCKAGRDIGAPGSYTLIA